jgi:SH3-like domain-containing protein
MKKIFVFIFLIIIFFNFQSQAAKNEFYFTKSNNINARTGPENFYKVKMVYKKKFLLLKILNESDEWYQIEDIEGDKGWIHKNYLSKQKKKQYVTVIEKNDIQCYEKPNLESKVVFMSGYLVNFELKKCEGDFCLITKQKIKGWCEKNKLWGIL